RRHTTFSRDWSSDVCSSDLSNITSSPSPTSSTPLETYLTPETVLPEESKSEKILPEVLTFPPKKPKSVFYKFARNGLEGELEVRSEERRVGKERTSRESAQH